MRDGKRETLIPGATQIRRDLRRWGAHYRCVPAAKPGEVHSEVTRGDRYIGCTSALPRAAAVYACWVMAGDEVKFELRALERAAATAAAAVSGGE